MLESLPSSTPTSIGIIEHTFSRHERRSGSPSTLACVVKEKKKRVPLMTIGKSKPSLFGKLVTPPLTQAEVTHMREL